MNEVVVIIGAALPGLATALHLNLLGIPNIIFEKKDSAASFWTTWTYDRIKVDLTQFLCALPGVPHPSTSIAGKDITRHIDEYNQYMKLRVVYDRQVRNAVLDREAGTWRIKTCDTVTGKVEVHQARFVVVATGRNSGGLVPNFPGLEEFTGEIVHSRQYRNGVRYVGKRVLVVGTGQWVLEIAFNLRGFGAVPSIAFWSQIPKVIVSVRGKEITFWNGRRDNFDAIIVVMGSPDNAGPQNADQPQNNYALHAQNFPSYWKGKNGNFCAGRTAGGLVGVFVDAVNISNEIKMAYIGNDN